MTDDRYRSDGDCPDDRWPCGHRGHDGELDCGQPVEANPTLYLSLAADGSWYIEGIADDAATATCTEGHHQHSEILDKSMTAFLEEQFPGGTWQGSAPDRD